MFKPATERILEFVRDYITINGYSPTQAEIATHTGYNGTTVLLALDRLETHGLIVRKPHIPRSITIVNHLEQHPH